MFDLDKAVSVRKGEDLPYVSLSEYLKSSGLGNLKSIKQFPGGYSNLTYLLETDEQKSYVLRKPPIGAEDIKGGHNMAREYGVLKALEKAGFIQIPKPVLLCENEAILNSVFYIMEKVDGCILRAPDAVRLRKENNKAFFQNLSNSICLTQVALHNIDIHETGLVSIGNPEGYVERQVNGWQKRYLASQTDEIKALEAVAKWLEKNLPKSSYATLIHNDYKYDNLILDLENPSNIKAILDWEMCTVGDPLMDLGTTLAYWAEMRDNPFMKAFNLSWVPGNLSRMEYADLYAKQSDRDISNILFYYVFGLYKNAVIIQQIYGRYKKGLTKDSRFENLIDGVRVLAESASNSISNGAMI